MLVLSLFSIYLSTWPSVAVSNPFEQVLWPPRPSGMPPPLALLCLPPLLPSYFCYFLFEAGSQCVVQVGLELII